MTTSLQESEIYCNRKDFYDLTINITFYLLPLYAFTVNNVYMDQC